MALSVVNTCRFPIRPLPAKSAKRTKSLKPFFLEECERYNVFPLDDRGAERISIPKPPPGGADPTRRHFTYYPGAVRLAETAAVNTKNRSHRIEIQIKEGGEGVLLAMGGLSAGYALYVLDGHVIYHYNFFEKERTSIRSQIPLPTGPSTVTLDFRYDGGGAGKGADGVLMIDGQEVGRARIENTVAARFSLDTFGVGYDTGSPVSHDYKPPFPFTGTIGKVDITIGEAGLSELEERILQARFYAGANY
jgi:hypothetical protein